MKEWQGNMIIALLFAVYSELSNESESAIAGVLAMGFFALAAKSALIQP